MIISLAGMTTHNEKQNLLLQVLGSNQTPENKTNFPVDISQAASLQPIQLDKLIFTLLPNDENHDSNGIAQSSSIIWNPHTSLTADGSIDHQGLVRVRVGSIKSVRDIINTNKEKYNSYSDNASKEEVVWHIDYALSSKAPHNISFIEIDPKCFGASKAINNNNACVFDSKDIEFSSSYKTELICSPVYEYDSSAVKRVYIIRASGKRDMLLSYLYDEGSGGGSSSVELVDPSKGGDVCK